MRSASGSLGEPKACARQCGSAMRSRRYSPTGRRPAAGRPNRPAMSSRGPRCCCRAIWQSRRYGLWRREVVKLRELAHSRTGDKGNTSNISVIAYDEKHYPLLERHITAERMKEHFAEIAHGEVTRYELPKIGALNFVLSNALGGGVTRSLALDAHGKGLSSAILDLEIPDEDQPV